MKGVAPTARSSILAVDIGGTTIKGAVFAAGREMVGDYTAPTFSSSSSAFDTVVTVVSELVAASERLGLNPAAIGLGTPGLVDKNRRVVRYAANLQWRDLPLAQRLEERYGLPVVIDHDSRTAARAEIALRDAAQDFVFIPIGTGISAATVIGGDVVNGAGGMAGELGHMPVIAGGEDCSCGQVGCLEVYASAAGILTRYRAAGGSHAQDAAGVARLVGSDPLADQVWSEAVAALATAVTTVTALLDPAEVVLGGGLAAAGPVLLTPLRGRVADMLAWRKPPVMTLSAAGPRAGLLGAALLATHSLGSGAQ